MKLSALRSISILTLGLLFASSGFSQSTTDEADATSEQRQASQRFSQIPHGVPIVMLNMLNFRDVAEYADGRDSISGQDAYAKYRVAASKLVTKVGGAPLWSGDAKAAVIAPEGEHWDEVFLVRYPSLTAFFSMINSDDYQAVLFHRTAALEDSRLIATVEKQ